MGGDNHDGPEAQPLVSDLLWEMVEHQHNLLQQLAMLAAETRRLEEEVFTSGLDEVRLSSTLLRQIAAALGSERSARET